MLAARLASWKYQANLVDLIALWGRRWWRRSGWSLLETAHNVHHVTQIINTLLIDELTQIIIVDGVECQHSRSHRIQYSSVGSSVWYLAEGLNRWLSLTLFGILTPVSRCLLLALRGKLRTVNVMNVMDKSLHCEVVSLDVGTLEQCGHRLHDIISAAGEKLGNLSKLSFNVW